MIRVKSLLFICIQLVIYKISAQSILNGGLETNTTPSCNIDIPNSQFNKLVPNVIALGTYEKLDLLASGCNQGNPVEGKNFIALEINNGKTDAVSFEVDQLLKTDQSYFASFYARVNQDALAKNIDLHLEAISLLMPMAIYCLQKVI